MTMQTRGFGPVVLCQVSFLTLLLWSSDTRAMVSPLETVRTATTQALTVLQNPSSQGAAYQQERLDKMWEIILPRLDPQEIALRSLGKHWNALTEEQRGNFLRLFTQLVKRAYSSTFARYTKESQVSFDRQHIDGDSAEVETRIIYSSQNKSFSVTYRLSRKGEEWLVYDVVAGNVSMVQNYRNQFHRIMQKSSYEGLVQALEKKLKETEK